MTADELYLYPPVPINEGSRSDDQNVSFRLSRTFRPSAGYKDFAGHLITDLLSRFQPRRGVEPSRITYLIDQQRVEV